MKYTNNTTTLPISEPKKKIVNKYAFVTHEGEICGELTCESGRNYANSLEGPIP